MALTRKQVNRQIRQDELRAKLSAGSHINDVIDIADKLREPEGKLESTDIQRLKASADIKLKLIDKYLPSLKQVDMNVTDNRDPKDCTTEELMYYRQHGEYPDSLRH